MKVELAQITRSYWVTDDEGRDFTVIETYDENTQSVDWEVTSPDDKEIDEAKKEEVIQAVMNYQREQ